LAGFQAALKPLSDQSPAVRELVALETKIGREPIVTAIYVLVHAIAAKDKSIGLERPLPVLVRSDSSPHVHLRPDASPRALRGYAKRLGRVLQETHSYFGTECPDLAVLAERALLYAKEYERDPGLRTWRPSRPRDPERHNPLGAGPPLEPATEAARALDIILEALAPGERYSLIGALLRDLFGVENHDAEAIRHRIGDFRHRREGWYPPIPR
jgi:hypothetical protein